MAVFNYSALNLRSLPVQGTVNADTPRQARDQLRLQGLTVETLTQQGPAASRRWGKWRSDSKQIAPLMRELATLLAVGVPLAEALESAARTRRGKFKTTVQLLRDRVNAGVSLCESMSEQPRIFDELCISITEVGEEAGTLDVALGQLAEFKERSANLRGRIATALIYPAFVLTMAIGVSVFLMTFVVPNILQPLVEQGRPLPLPTKIVKAASDFLIGWGCLLGTALVGMATLLGWVTQTKQGKHLIDSLILKLPIAGDLVRTQTVVKVCVVVGALLKSGVVFDKALEAARKGTGNVIMAAALADCEQAVCAGGDVACALEQTDAFPPAVVQVFAAGQQSGRLEEMLQRLGQDYDAQVAAAAARLSSVLEPILILVLSGLVLMIAMATMLPILEAGDVLQ